MNARPPRDANEPEATPTTALLEAWAEVPPGQRADALDALRLVLSDPGVLGLLSSWGWAEYAIRGLPRDVRERTYERCVGAVVREIRAARTPRPVQPPSTGPRQRRRGNVLAFAPRETAARSQADHNTSVRRAMLPRRARPGGEGA